MMLQFWCSVAFFLVISLINVDAADLHVTEGRAQKIFVPDNGDIDALAPLETAREKAQFSDIGSRIFEDKINEALDNLTDQFDSTLNLTNTDINIEYKMMNTSLRASCPSPEQVAGCAIVYKNNNCGGEKRSIPRNGGKCDTPYKEWDNKIYSVIVKPGCTFAGFPEQRCEGEGGAWRLWAGASLSSSYLGGWGGAISSWQCCCQSSRNALSKSYCSPDRPDPIGPGNRAPSLGIMTYPYIIYFLSYATIYFAGCF